LSALPARTAPQASRVLKDRENIDGQAPLVREEQDGSYADKAPFSIQTAIQPATHPVLAFCANNRHLVGTVTHALQAYRSLWAYGIAGL